MCCCHGDCHVTNTVRICSPCCNLSVEPEVVPLDGMRATGQRMCLPTKKVAMKINGNLLKGNLSDFLMTMISKSSKT